MSKEHKKHHSRDRDTHTRMPGLFGKPREIKLSAADRDRIEQACNEANTERVTGGSILGDLGIVALFAGIATGLWFIWQGLAGL